MQVLTNIKIKLKQWLGLCEKHQWIYISRYNPTYQYYCAKCQKFSVLKPKDIQL